MMSSTADIMCRGMECLKDGLGEIEAEMFVSILLREKFDYTKWHHTAFDNMTLEELNKAAVEYNKDHSYIGNAKVIY